MEQAIPFNTDPQHNIAFHCCTRHCQEGNGHHIAFRWIDSAGPARDYSFTELEQESNKAANVLTQLGIQKGEVVFTFLPKMPVQFFTFLGILKMQAVAGTLFSNFGEEALLDRLGDSHACALVTKKALLKKVLRVKDKLPELRFILVVDIEEDIDAFVLSLPKRMKQAKDNFTIEPTLAETPSVLHYTSGSTGKPKGVQHVHKSLLLQSWTAANVLGLHTGDIYWCTADQGWVTGTSYGIIGPWSLGITQIHFGGTYDAAAWMKLLQDEKVDVWYTAPTALRMLMREERSLFGQFDLSKLRHIFSVGEPLNPEVIHWSREVLNKDIYDTWFQTETGSIMICNRPGIDIRPGSMGKPIDLIEGAIVAEDGSVLGTRQTGNLCVRAGWDSMFIQYLNHPEVYNKKFKNGYYYSGDLAWRDDDGYYWFVGRNDDVINTAGHLISPFEIESALLEIPEIAESAVIAAPDEILFEKVVAYIRLREGIVWNDDLEMKIRLYLSNKLSSIATPQDMKVIDEIPKNKSGKIMRRVLKAWYMGEDPGDVSTLDI
jgi:acetyl-CoA synthetase